MFTLTRLLEHIEARVDPDHVQATERLHVDAMDFTPVQRLPLSIDFPPDPRARPCPYAEAFADVEKMLYSELALISYNVLNHVELRDDYPLQVRANYGICILNSLFGQKCTLTAGNMPWVNRVANLDDVKRLLDAGVPNLDAALGGRVISCMDFFRETFHRYPKIERCVRITQPDLQGPFDILDLMLGNDVFLLLYDEPDLIKALLALVSDTYIAYRRHIDPYLSDQVDDGRKCAVHHAIYAGKVVLKDDTAIQMISSEMYREFAIPYNARILRALGGGSMHFCGKRLGWHDQALLDQPISCVNYGNSDMQDFPARHAPLIAAKIPVVGFGELLPYDFLRPLVGSGPLTGMTLFSRSASLSEAEKTLCEHKALSLGKTKGAIT